MSKQPTATAFLRVQQSWASHLLEKANAAIDDREDDLRERQVPVELWCEDDALMELEEESIFLTRYIEEMEFQREYIREKYLGGS
jgi:hypothetical protein